MLIHKHLPRHLFFLPIILGLPEIYDTLGAGVDKTTVLIVVDDCVHHGHKHF